MVLEGIFQITLFLATFLSSLVAGLLFAFAIVVMPGLARLNDREFIRTFQVIDGVIQNNHPLFIGAWLGSALMLIVSAVLGLWHLEGVSRMLLIGAALVHIVTIQLPTISINIPLNNKLQTLNVDAMNAAAHQIARQEFEPRWNQWNIVRAVTSSLVLGLLIILLFML